MVDNQIKLAVSTRNRMPYYIYNNRLENVPFYSNIYSRSLYEGVVITSGMHTIAYWLSILDVVCSLVNDIKDIKIIRRMKISVLYKSVNLSNYPLNKDEVVSIINLSKFVSDGIKSNSIGYTSIDDVTVINYNILNLHKLTERCFNLHNIPFRFRKHIEGRVNRLMLYAIQRVRIDYSKFDFVLDPVTGVPSEVELHSNIQDGPGSFKSSLMVWKLPHFDISSPSGSIKSMIRKFDKHRSIRTRNISTYKVSKNVRDQYLNIRINDPCYTFSDSDIDSIHNAYSIYRQNVNEKHPLIDLSPDESFESKPLSDSVAMELWNSIMPANFRVYAVDQFKSVGVQFVKHLDNLKPNGNGYNEVDMVRYVTASSPSAFIGIQKPSQSRFALNSMIKSLESHAVGNTFDRPWLLKNLEFLGDYTKYNPSSMEREYGDLLLKAKTSSSSIPGAPNFRDFVFQNDINDIYNVTNMNVQNTIPYLMIAGTRTDRRGKFRLVFSMPAQFRILDFLYTNGSYALCMEGGPLAQYTTEGYNSAQMWPELVLMSDRKDVRMICIDFEGYDSQLSIWDYIGTTLILNKFRIQNERFSRSFSWYINWLKQPKPLVTRIVVDGKNVIAVLLEYTNTLASGLHGTHSYENLFGVSTKIEMQNIGIVVTNAWFNGDDQNIQVRSDQIDLAMDWLQHNFNISFAKSLVNHDLTVWGKLWFTKEFHPMWEMGTVRSIFEREGGENEIVEPSKLSTNYCKILQVIITLIRLGKSYDYILKWTQKLCNISDPVIDWTRIPMNLNILEISTTNVNLDKPKPVGLDKSRAFLMAKTFNLKLFNVHDYYTMLSSMYYSNARFTQSPTEIVYFPSNTILRIERGINYSYDSAKDVYWVYRNISRVTQFTDEQMFVRDVLQGTKSFDGPFVREYHFDSMISLAVAINNRNKDVWKFMQEL